MQLQPRKHELDHADYTAPTRQHELDHTDHTAHTDHTDHLSEVWKLTFARNKQYLGLITLPPVIPTWYRYLVMSAAKS